MSVNGKFRAIAKADCLEVADRFAVPAAKDTLAEVLDAVQRWSGFAAAAGLPADLAARIRADFALA